MKILKYVLLIVVVLQFSSCGTMGMNHQEKRDACYKATYEAEQLKLKTKEIDFDDSLSICKNYNNSYADGQDVRNNLSLRLGLIIAYYETGKHDLVFSSFVICYN